MTTTAKFSGNIRVAFVQATWHADIVNQARDGFLAEMTRQGVARESISVIELPGAFEIPLHAKKLAQSGKFDAIVAAGLVVDGGIYRHDFVATAVIQGLMSVQLETGVPVFSAVLTPHHFHAGAEHQQFFSDHFVHKGAEAAQACLRTVTSLRQLNALTQ
ncbi:MAG: 6,7-dimethyl-8-ribityllumazine synthase [Burkholderiales bacterium]|nr:6,7-dimethyl-8-ribityllumazine synthase [Burkholderiales bacterium]